jgi:hypothetical protein
MVFPPLFAMFIGELCVLGSLFSFASDTKTNVQTYVAFDEIKSDRSAILLRNRLDKQDDCEHRLRISIERMVIFSILCVLGSLFSFASDTKTNVQTYVAFDEIKSWLQRSEAPWRYPAPGISALVVRGPVCLRRLDKRKSCQIKWSSGASRIA